MLHMAPSGGLEWWGGRHSVVVDLKVCMDGDVWLVPDVGSRVASKRESPRCGTVE